MDSKEEIFDSIKGKLSEIESVEEEITGMYAEIIRLEYEGKQIANKSIESMKDEICKCFVELESFVKTKKNELLLRVNEMSCEETKDNAMAQELSKIKDSNKALVTHSIEYLNNKMAEYELLEYNEHTLAEIDGKFNENMDKFNENILQINKIIDRISIHESFKFELHSSIYKSLLNNIVNVGIIRVITPSKDGDLLVAKGQRCELKSNYEYEFNNVILSENSKLTVKSWNSNLKNGGMLFLKCLSRFVMEKNSRITLSYKGYKCGEGIGAGGIGISGAGAGFGEFGKDGKYSNGGVQYGDSLLTSMYMGSGGGASEKCNGGNGGGSIWLYALNDVILKENTYIAANGQDGNDASLLTGGGGGGGGGSGGSIYVEATKLKLSSTSKVTARGGRGGKAVKPFGYHGGDGGHGRICIKVKGLHSVGYLGNIVPEPSIENT